MIELDQYGDHAEDCPCERCEAGFGPTPRQRDASRRAFFAAATAKAKLQEQATRGQGWVSRPMPRVPDHRPYSPEELADLERMRKDFRR